MPLVLGIHVNKSNSFVPDSKSIDIQNAITRDVDEYGLNAAQIFASNPRSGIPLDIEYKSVMAATTDIDLSVHGSYTTVALWKVNNDNKSSAKSQVILNRIRGEFNATKKIGAWSMVIHITKQLPEDLVESVNIIKPMVKKSGVQLALEMVANKADREKTYETPEKLNNLISLLGPDEDYYGIVIDTAHIWGAGIDVRLYANMKDWLDRLVYKKKIIMFHLNGSESERSSGKDKHAICFSPEDKIWNGIAPHDSGVRAVVEFATTRNITIICEINRGSRNDAVKLFQTIHDMSL
jgi:deoxyribonuclease-4